MIVNNIETPKNKKLHELYVLLNTERGSVPLERDLGMDPRLVDKPINVIKKNLEYQVKKQVRKYIKGLEVIKLDCYYSNEKLIIECEVEFNG
ncbi:MULTISPECIES: hypothetical protein [unclassified Fusobacterium]|uniref:hypothetical protein n=1 Tax=unclassified Fusobacterium TaxID=2648384 RepID=UPI001B8CCC09|nr:MULTISPECIES: hypothetical protein [unclassified Fusobacterium]MBR8701467.1 hypothetical protein [Fusobacterium sp. DD45]MBR8711235.1 hypothetical protein [Fusobacterium sp. DD28]MBR8751772.1 hypothetical protein [Fusobacterium sp. DD26]